jgi:acyl-CoA thioesterase FadM
VSAPDTGAPGDSPGRDDPSVPPIQGIEIPYRVRFDECNPDGIARSSAILRYAQDIAWIHSERLGFGREWYAERGLAWVVRAAELTVLADVRLGSTLTLSTAVIGFRKVWVRRLTEGRLADGTLALLGHTDWVMTDHRGLPARIPPEFLTGFDVPPGSFEPGRVPLPPTPDDAVLHRALVRPQDLDPMGHVNNAAYLDYLEEALFASGPGGAAYTASIPRRIRLEYLAPASPGNTLTGAVWALGATPAAGEGRAWRLSDGAGRELARGGVTADARTTVATGAGGDTRPA